MMPLCPRNGFAVVNIVNILLGSAEFHSKAVSSPAIADSVRSSRLMSPQQKRFPKLSVIPIPCMAAERQAPEIHLKTVAWCQFKRKSKSFPRRRYPKLLHESLCVIRPEVVLVTVSAHRISNQPADIVVVPVSVEECFP